MVPVKYNIRSLRVRWVTTAMTAAAIALVVCVSVLTFGLAAGLKQALTIAGSELDLIVLRKGSQNETSSGIEQQVAHEVSTLDGIALDDQGRPLASVEFVTILTRPRRGDNGTTNVVVRGLTDVGRGLRPGFRIVQGRDLRPGQHEAITSRAMAERFEDMGRGESLPINNVPFEIVGYFEAGGAASESEVWTDLRDLTTVRKTPGAVSSVNLRARDAAARESIVHRIQEDPQFNLRVVDTKQYYEDQLQSASAIRWIGYFIAGCLTVGAMFAAANTMYGAVASRAREIGTLRALGYTRTSVLLSFLLESVILCLLGGVLGCLAILPFNGYSTGTANFSTFSEIVFAFRFGPTVLLQGVLMALTMGLLGGLFPAVRAVRLNIVRALRER
jgi:putative ABC transport system permease protein